MPLMHFMRNALIVVSVLLFASCTQATLPDESADAVVDGGVTADPVPDAGEEDPVEPPPDDSEEPPPAPGIEAAGTSRRFDLVSPMCTIELFDSGAGCPAGDDKCLCKPEFDALNPAKGSAGNTRGRVIIVAQPKWGKRADGTYAFDAYAAIKAKNNQVGQYVNELNPSMTCTVAQAWTPDKGCAGGSGCGWRCVRGDAWADQLIAKQEVTFAGYALPQLMALNEAWSTIYEDSTPGIYYRQFLRDLTKRLKDRGRLPLLYVQQRTTAAGPYTLFSEIAQYALIGAESYLSGREIMNAPGQCAAPYDGTNWCFQQYRTMRNAIRNSGNPAIPYARNVMLEHFATNTYRYTDANGNAATSSWGRSMENGNPTTDNWKLAIERRARAVKALTSLGGVSSYCFACNGSNTGSSYRVEFSNTWARIELP